MPYGRRSKYVYKRLLKGRRGYKKVCARGSIRTKTVPSRRYGHVLVRVCCPEGWWSRRRRRCRRGMRGIEVLKPKSRVLRLAQRVRRRLAANPRRRLRLPKGSNQLTVLGRDRFGIAFKLCGGLITEATWNVEIWERAPRALFSIKRVFRRGDINRKQALKILKTKMKGREHWTDAEDSKPVDISHTLGWWK